MTDDIVARARSELSLTKCSDDMRDFFRVGLVRELVAEVELERAQHPPVIMWRRLETVYGKLDSARAEVERLRGALVQLITECRTDPEFQMSVDDCADRIEDALAGDR